jgi:excisionase family DNA binding protein
MKQDSISLKQKEYLSRQEAADYANVSTDTIDRMAANGLLEKIKLNSARNGKVLIPRKSIDKLLNSLIVKGKEGVL